MTNNYETSKDYKKLHIPMNCNGCKSLIQVSFLKGYRNCGTSKYCKAYMKYIKDDALLEECLKYVENKTED